MNILSMSSHGGQPFLCPYSMSKRSPATLTKNVALSVVKRAHSREWFEYRLDGYAGEHAIQKTFHHAASDWLERAEARQPFGRLLKPFEVAQVAAFLLSERAGLMTGSIIDFDQSIVGTHEY